MQGLVQAWHRDQILGFLLLFQKMEAKGKVSKEIMSNSKELSSWAEQILTDLQILFEIGQVAVDNATAVRQHAIFRRALEDVPTRQQRQEGVADTEKVGKGGLRHMYENR